VIEAVVAVVRAERALGAADLLAVLCEPSRVAEVVEGLRAQPDLEVGLGAEGLTAPVSVLSPQDAKGLEFDAVVVVDPAGIVDSSSRGAADLYVAMTRPTQRLSLVALGRLPAGLTE
jgi:superfamily I DNA/RNA helicase